MNKEYWTCLGNIYRVSTDGFGTEHVMIYLLYSPCEIKWAKSGIFKDRLALVEHGAQQIPAHLLNLLNITE